MQAIFLGLLAINTEAKLVTYLIRRDLEIE